MSGHFLRPLYCTLVVDHHGLATIWPQIMDKATTFRRDEDQCLPMYLTLSLFCDTLPSPVVFTIDKIKQFACIHAVTMSKLLVIVNKK